MIHNIFSPHEETDSLASLEVDLLLPFGLDRASYAGP